ncbi:hypothetical protein JOB18_009220 [Solea senegalensis]|uniref:Uncharacterized protein n=1 Tax=Solea senegalensis TaxID=28829 RepID=A0AAV6QC06_SOLSE|nr:hypothetical protein JOB18_009220 [Solea senegalensis]
MDCPESPGAAYTAREILGVEIVGQETCTVNHEELRLTLILSLQPLLLDFQIGVSLHLLALLKHTRDKIPTDHTNSKPIWNGNMFPPHLLERKMAPCWRINNSLGNLEFSDSLRDQTWLLIGGSEEEEEIANKLSGRPRQHVPLLHPCNGLSLGRELLPVTDPTPLINPLPSSAPASSSPFPVTPSTSCPQAVPSQTMSAHTATCTP